MSSRIGLGLSVLLEALLPLIRTIALARLLPQDQFGIALTVLATITMVEMCCDIGLPMSAVRGSATTSIRRFLGTLHSLNLVRSGGMILLSVLFLALQQSALDSTFGRDLFVLVPLIFALKAFDNLAIKQLTRRYDFRGEAVVTSSAQIVWTVVAIVSAMITQSYVSMFHGMLAAAICTAIVSNILSHEPWRATWTRTAAIEALQFGTPLVPNGVTSAIAGSDRLMVGSFIGTKQVAVYGVASSLISLPRSILWRISTSVLVPHFANLMPRPADEARFYRHWLLGICAVSTAYALGLMLLGPWFIRLAFGPHYVPTMLLMNLFAINAFIKFMMFVPIPAGFARGQTSLVLLGSVVSALGALPAGLGLFFGMRSLDAFVFLLNVGEGIGLLWFLSYAARLHGLAIPLVLAVTAIPLLGLGAITFAMSLQGCFFSILGCN